MMKETGAADPTPNSDDPQPNWKIAVIAPSPASIEPRLVSAPVSRIRTLRNASASSTNPSRPISTRYSGSLLISAFDMSMADAVDPPT
jgi:hypothetical protein